MTSLLDKLGPHFAEHVLDPTRWIAKAHRLMSAAERLVPDIEKFWKTLEEMDTQSAVPLADMAGIEYQNIFMMLYGFAIENLCKAHVITKLNKDELSRLKRGKLPNKLITHDLEDLVAKKLGLSVSDEEKELLKRLEAAVKWAGRYPVSIGPGNQKKQEIKDQLLAMPQGLCGDDLTSTRRLTQRIMDEVRAKTRT